VVGKAVVAEGVLDEAAFKAFAAEVRESLRPTYAPDTFQMPRIPVQEITKRLQECIAKPRAYDDFKVVFEAAVRKILMSPRRPLPELAPLYEQIEKYAKNGYEFTEATPLLHEKPLTKYGCAWTTGELLSRVLPAYGKILKKIDTRLRMAEKGMRARDGVRGAYATMRAGIRDTAVRAQGSLYKAYTQLRTGAENPTPVPENVEPNHERGNKGALEAHTRALETARTERLLGIRARLVKREAQRFFHI
jgi:hypothetical protein